jgi:hypothetical protein
LTVHIFLFKEFKTTHRKLMSAWPSWEYNIKVLRNSRDSEFFYWTFCETLTNLTEN